jgi:hypothetical protein
MPNSFDFFEADAAVVVLVAAAAAVVVVLVWSAVRSSGGFVQLKV